VHILHVPFQSSQWFGVKGQPVSSQSDQLVALLCGGTV